MDVVVVGGKASAAQISHENSFEPALHGRRRHRIYGPPPELSAGGRIRSDRLDHLQQRLNAEDAVVLKCALDRAEESVTDFLGVVALQEHDDPDVEEVEKNQAQKEANIYCCIAVQRPTVHREVKVALAVVLLDDMQKDFVDDRISALRSGRRQDKRWERKGGGRESA